MEPQPVRQAQTPSYPTRRDILAGAAGFVVAGFCGRFCLFAATEEGKTVVAPIFEHGEGRGATGCVVVSPPVFLSEEEAMQVIREELGKHGIQLKPGDIWKDVRIPQRFEKCEVVGEGDDIKFGNLKIVEDPKKAKPFKVSGIDADKGIGVKFVSKRNYFTLGGVQQSYYDESSGVRRHVSAQKYDLKETAKYVMAQLEKQGKTPVHFGLFYDPLWEAQPVDEKKRDFKQTYEAWKRQDRTPAQKKAEMKGLLRLQVQDFAAWLKKKKVINDPKK